MGNMMQGVNQPQQIPPPPPIMQYFIALNGQQSGSFTFVQLQQMSQNGSFTKDHHVWKQGMSEWIMASDEQDLAKLFSTVPPPPPPPVG